MPYNSITSRSDSTALIPEDVSREILKGTLNKSIALQMFRHRTMSRAQQRMPVLAALPTAYFLTGDTLNDRDTGLKQTTEVAWGNKFLNAEELAVIVPVPEALLDDVDYDLWGEIKPLIEEAIGVAVDDAILFGVNKPATWDAAIVTAANSAGNLVVAGTSTVDYLDDVNTLMGLVEADGYEVTGFVARPQVKAKLRGMRDSQKQFLYLPESGPRDGGEVARLYGEPLKFCRSGLSGFATGAANFSLICGDWKQGLIGIRQDLTWKILDQAVIQDNTGAIQFNLAQQDMVALRVVARFAWATPNPINRLQAVEASRYPFGALQQKATTGGE